MPQWLSNDKLLYIGLASPYLSPLHPELAYNFLCLCGLLQQNAMNGGLLLTVWRPDAQGQGPSKFGIWGGPTSWFTDCLLLCLHLEGGARGLPGSPL